MTMMLVLLLHVNLMLSLVHFLNAFNFISYASPCLSLSTR